MPLEVQRNDLSRRFRAVREASMAMVQGLKPEDFRIQPCPEASPPWWNLAHTSWFFARMLALMGGEVTAEDTALTPVLNSYYASFGPRLQRDRRGLLTRPTTDEVLRYRHDVDRRIDALIETIHEQKLPECARLLRIGCEHEQQHQELFFTELKYLWFQNPPELRPVYRPRPGSPTVCASPRGEVFFQGGLVCVGSDRKDWCWDNELGVHQQYLQAFGFSDCLVTNGDYLAFMEDGGYRQQKQWLDNGWSAAQNARWKAPLYWERNGNEWWQWTLTGMKKVDEREPVCHVSFYEADAYARWCQQRLPTEYEWEHVARSMNVTPEEGNFLEDRHYHPLPDRGNSKGVRQLLGDVWEWTSSYYAPYPGYEPFPGPLVEYNSKFMDNQRVLRGGSCVTPRGHIRLSYRNFWPPETRFQFSGIRLARESA